jgi:hypothetical protein
LNFTQLNNLPSGGKIEQKRFKNQIENASLLRKSMMNNFYVKRNQRHKDSHLFENNPKLTEI